MPVAITERAMSDNLEGGCACRAVRYRLSTRPMFVHCCHCRDCQRQTGSAFVLNALIETDRVILLSGETKAVAVPTDSGRPHEIHRCPSCEVALWSVYGGVQKLRFVRVGTLDDPVARRTSISMCARKCRGSLCPRAFRHSRPITIQRSFGLPKAWSGGAPSLVSPAAARK